MLNTNDDSYSDFGHFFFFLNVDTSRFHLEEYGGEARESLVPVFNII